MSGSGDYISREAALNVVNGWRDQLIQTYGKNDEYVKCLETVAEHLESLLAADVRPVPEGGIGEMSDGYHTFNGLYYQRMVLFAALVIAHNDKAWKSWKHEDGEPCFGGGWFIVGIDTPKGSYTYHYEDKYWNWFECEELPVAKHWDGHTEEDVTRLLSLDMPRWIPVTERLPDVSGTYLVLVKEPEKYTENRMRGEAEEWENFDFSHVEPVYYSKDQSIWDDDDLPMNANLDVVNTYEAFHVTHWQPLPEPPEEG